MHNPVSHKVSFVIILAITATFFLAILSLACQREAAQAPPATTPATSPGKRGLEKGARGLEKPAALPGTPSAPQVRDFILASSYTGEVRSVNKVDLTARVSGRIKQIKVDVGDKVKKGDLLAELEHDIPDIQVRQAEVALVLAREKLAKLEEGSRKEKIAIAEAAVKSAQAELDLLLAGNTKEKIAAARANVASKQALLDTLLAGATAEEIQQLTTEVRQAEAQVISTDVETARTLQTIRIADADTLNYNLASREAKLALDQVKVQIAKDKLAIKKAAPTSPQVAKLKADVDAAQADLEALLAPPKPEEVAKAESKVASVRQQLELDKNPFTAHDLEETRIGVQQAQVALDLAKANRDEAYLYAPFNGTVSARIASEGTLASASSPVLTIISHDIQAAISIEEAAVGKVIPDQMWDIRVLAYPDKVFKGKVKTISPALNSATRTFEVLLIPQSAEGVLLPGMFITASLPQ